MSGREPAWRVFAAELGGSRFEERGPGERAASYVLSPLGARMNRVLMVGTIAPPERIGDDEARPFLRARLTDPTGSTTVTAGSFQPRALANLQRVVTSVPCLVVGKAHLFVGRDGTIFPSVRAEALRSISEPELRAGWSEAADHALRRIAILEAVRAGRTPPTDPPVPVAWIEWARGAAARYPSDGPTGFRSSVAAVVQALDPSSRGSAPPPPALRPVAPAVSASPSVAVPPREEPRVRVTRPVPPAPAPTVVSAAGRAQESSFLDIIDDLSDRSADGYADLREAIGLAGRRGVLPEQAEGLLNRLEEEGVLEEPVVGKIRRA